MRSVGSQIGPGLTPTSLSLLQQLQLRAVSSPSLSENALGDLKHHQRQHQERVSTATADYSLQHHVEEDNCATVVEVRGNGSEIYETARSHNPQPQHGEEAGPNSGQGKNFFIMQLTTDSLTVTSSLPLSWCPAQVPQNLIPLEG